MLAKRIIPCLDVTGGRVVKGVNFTELRDAGDPVEIARRYDGQGADELTFLDITASSDGRDLILPIIEAVASTVFIPLTVGGGVRSADDVDRLLRAGADKVGVNTAAVARPELIAACVALIAHPDDERYADLIGQTVTSPLYGVELPVIAHDGAAVVLRSSLPDQPVPS